METKMNELIKEFAEQARKKPMGDSWCYTNPREFEQKFAELVIRECVHLVDTLNEAYEAPSTAGKFIKEHFGVE